MKGTFAWLLARRLGPEVIGKDFGFSPLVDIRCQKNTRLLTIDNCLQRMVGFRCEDIRDVFYATLSLVDWHGNKPHPDYKMSVFALALNVLEERSNDRSDYDKSFRSPLLARNLRLNEFNAEIRERIDRLSSRTPAPAAPNNAVGCNRHLVHAHGLPLCFNPSEPDHDHHDFYITENRKPGNFDLHGPALKSAAIQKGDWVLMPRTYQHNAMIVAREQSDGCFALVGYTTFEATSEKVFFANRVRINIIFDSEDLLIYAILDKTLEGVPRAHRRHANPTVLNLLSRRVCRYQGSSYAVRATQG